MNLDTRYQCQIATFYKFMPLNLDEVSELKAALETQAHAHSILGLFIVGPEGCNATFSGGTSDVKAFKTELRSLLKDSNLLFKDSWAPRPPFRNFKVKIRPEIVTLSTPELVPSGKHHHLSPEQWDQMLDSGALVLDTRNDYEYRIGHFKTAINPKIKEFGEFPKFLEESGIKKDEKVLIYCTGGIRCEKAILEMERQGFSEVYQLDGGILNYLSHRPHQNFLGECYVFDYRVAVTQELDPSVTYSLCPHCGDPAATTIECEYCHRTDRLCEKCANIEPKTCSKNCAHHLKMGHGFHRLHMDSLKKRGIAVTTKPQGSDHASALAADPSQ